MTQKYRDRPQYDRDRPQYEGGKTRNDLPRREISFLLKSILLYYKMILRCR